MNINLLFRFAFVRRHCIITKTVAAARFVSSRHVASTAMLIIVGGLFSPALMAQSTYPDRPVRLIVPYAPGGTADLVARVVGNSLQKTLGQTVVVENKAGAGGLIGTEAMTQASPDGYTIALGTFGSLVVNPITYTKHRFDYDTDIAYITNLVAVSAVLTANPDKVKSRDFASFLKEVKAKPRHYATPSSGVGGGSHLLIEYFNFQTGADLMHVPYRGQGPALTATIGGEVDVIMDQAPSALAQVKGGKLVPLATFGPHRLSELPDVPTFTELGYPDLDVAGVSWFGLIAPGKTPPAIIARLNAASLEALRDPELQEKLRQLSAVPVGNSPEAFRGEVKAAVAVSQDIVKRANITLNN